MTERRKPQQTPGTAHTPQDDIPDDFTFARAVYYESIDFLEEARRYSTSGNITEESRLIRASLYSIFSFLEATLNQSAYAHAKAHGRILNSFELDVLEQKETILDNKGYVVRRTKYYPFESRFSFVVLFLSGKEFDRGSKIWQDLIWAKELRDTWVHPKPPFDTWSINLDDAEKAIRTIRAVVLKMSEMMDEQYDRSHYWPEYEVVATQYLLKNPLPEENI